MTDNIETLKKIGLTDQTTKKIEKVLESLENGAATIVACASAGLNRIWFYALLKKHPELKDLYNEIREARTMAVEDSLYINAEKGNVSAQIFWLKNRASDRWQDSQSVDHKSTDGSMSPEKHDLSKLTDEELQTLRKIQEKIK
jgi:hypothetical protein